MTPEQQRIAIAEACGWKVQEELDGSGLWSAVNVSGNISNYRCGVSREHAERVCLPSCLTDLNAMHEAEKVLWAMEPVFLSAYCERLMKSRYPNEWGMAWNYIHATAAQRAEAFLRTLNLWKE